MNFTILFITLIALYLIFPFVMLGLRLMFPGFRAFWVVAALANLILWTGMFLVRLLIPFSVELASILSQAKSGMELSINLLVDPISWAFGISLSTLCLAGVLTDITRLNEHHWGAWAGGLFLTGLGLLAVFAGNLLTLVLVWVAIDICEVFVLVNQNQVNQDQDETKNRPRLPVRNPLSTAVFLRLSGIFLVVIVLVSQIAANSVNLSEMLSILNEPQGNLESLTPTLVGLLLLAAVLRLNTFSNSPVSSLKNQHHAVSSHSLHTILRLVSAAASLTLVVWLAQTGVQGALFKSSIQPFLVLAAGLIGIYNALRWAFVRGLQVGRNNWILGMAALIFTAAIRAQPDTSLVWTLAALLPGGLILLSKVDEEALPVEPSQPTSIDPPLVENIIPKSDPLTSKKILEAGDELLDEPVPLTPHDVPQSSEDASGPIVPLNFAHRNQEMVELELEPATHPGHYETHRSMASLPVLGLALLLLSSLPFTPTWTGLNLYTQGGDAWGNIAGIFGLLLCGLTQVVLLAGYTNQAVPGAFPSSWAVLKQWGSTFTARLTRQSRNPYFETNQERWTRAIFVWGLIAILIVYLVASFWSGLFTPMPPFYAYIFILAGWVIVGLSLFVMSRGWRFPNNLLSVVGTIFSLGWLAQIGLSLFKGLRRITRLISFILEGEGGVLWSLLLLILLLTVLLGAGAGR